MLARPTSLLPKQDEANLLYLSAVQDQSAGRIDAAIAQLDAALRVRPDFPEALCLGGFLLQELGFAAGALAFYERALALNPQYALAWFNRGCLLEALGHAEPALDSFAQACRWNPSDAKAQCNRGAALYALGSLDEAIAAYSLALALQPDFPEAALNLGNAFLRSGRYVEAQSAYQDAIALRQDYPAAFCGLGIALKELARVEEAEAAFDRALALDPQSPETLSNKGSFDLLLGRFDAGWEGYEHRWAAGQRPIPVCNLRFDRLSAVAGKSLLIVNDHALGDTIQFFRYVLVLARAGAKVTFAGPGRLRRLLSSAPAPIIWQDQADLSGDFDARIALSSLPRAFAVRPENIPLAEGYLAAEPERVAFWRERIGADGLKIGLCWQGNLDFRVDPRRSIPREAMAPLGQVAKIRLFSLQKAFDPAESGIAPRFLPLGEFDAGPDAFVDTAAIIANLDLVVTCDTSIAHLAGALGRRTWLALKHVPEWRWMLDAQDTPWYRSIRLFRCAPGDNWPSLFVEMAAMLENPAENL